MVKRLKMRSTVHRSPIGQIALLSAGLVGWLLFVLPVAALIWRATMSGGWQSLPQSEIVRSAVWLSLRTTFVSVLITVALGTPLAFILARWSFPGKRLAQVFVELPVVMPPAVAGLALLLTFGRRGVLGDVLETIGISIAFSSGAVIIAQTFVAAPFFIRAAQVAFIEISNELEDAARVDGASEWEVFWFVTLPLTVRSLIAGLALSWARAMGEFGATILFAGSLQGRTQTMTLLVYDVFQRDLDAAIWTGLLLILIALIALLFSQWLARGGEQ